MWKGTFKQIFSENKIFRTNYLHFHLSLIFFLAGERTGENKLYYINIDFYNMAKSVASVQYREFEDVKEQLVHPKQQKSVELAVMMTDVPVFTMFAKNKDSGNDYFLNGESTWTIYGSEFKGERNLIDISENGKSKQISNSCKYNLCPMS